MKGLVFGVVGSLVAIGVTAFAAKPAADLYSAASAGLAGSYQGAGEGADSVVKIVAVGKDSYRVGQTVSNARGCMGSLKGEGQVQGSVLTVTIPYDDTERCIMRYSRSGRALTVESQGCFYFHGASCGFDGQVTATAASVDAHFGAETLAFLDPSAVTEAAGKTVQVTTAWLTGAWVTQGSYCASGAAWQFRADGSAGDDSVEGFWSLKGQNLTLRSRAYEIGDDRPNTRPFKTSVSSLKALGPNDVLWDGMALKRCPPGHDYEPWHPGGR